MLTGGLTEGETEKGGGRRRGDRKKIAEEGVIEGKREEGKDVRKRKGGVEEKCV